MKVLLAVSSGIDSMYMLERALEGALFDDFGVAHCNFSLRGEESDGDEAFIRSWCASNGVELFCKKFDTERFASERGISIEMAARELRYGWFAELCAERGFDAVAIAHNADDNAETLLLNILRGCGSRGLRGMSSDSGDFPNRILRPLLGLSRAQIRQWMESNGKQWREDHTNFQDFCKRNKLRHNVMPVFAEINPSYLRTLSSDMARWRETDDIAQDYYDQAIRTCLTPDGALIIKELVKYKHWPYLLFRFTEGRLNADQLMRLREAIASGRPLGGKTFGHYRILKGKLRG